MKRQKWWITGLLAAMTVALTVAVKMVDIGEYNGAEVGFWGLNKAVFDTIGADATWDRITDVVMLIVLAMGIIFACMGIWQWIKRKNLKKVDWEIRALGIVYMILGVIYVVFEKLVINYAPTAELKASFPSSHVLLTLTVGLTVATLVPKYVKSIVWQFIINIALTVLMFVMIMGRTYSGQHWATDILAAVLMSATLLSAYLNMIKFRPIYCD